MSKHYPLNANGVEDAGRLPWTDGVPSTGTEGSYPGYAIVVDTESEVLAAQDVAGLVRNSQDQTQLGQAIARGAFLGGLGGSANALTAALPNSVTWPSLLPGMRFSAIASQPNTGSVTITLSGFSAPPGTISLLRRDGQFLQPGDVQPGLLSFVYDGSNFRVGIPVTSELAVSPAQTSLIHFGLDTGSSASALAANVTPDITSYVQGYTYVIFTANASVSGGTTANLDGRGTRPVTRADNTPIQGGDWGAGQGITLFDDGTRLQLVGVTTSNLPTSAIVSLTPGSGNFTVPAGVTRLKRVRGWGGGGSGGGSTGTAGAGSGGGGGGYFEAYNITVTPGQTIAYQVGGGGPASGGDGNNGGSTVLNGIATALGGGRGLAGVNGPQTSTAGAGGSGSVQVSGFAVKGSDAGTAYGLSSPYFVGIGGASPFGGGSPGPNVGTSGFPGNYPGGGSNGGSAGNTSGQGADGLMLIEY